LGGPPHGATNSTRRFNARPASLAFDPTGARNPTPAVRSRGCGNPIALHQLRGDRLRTPARQIEIVVVGALVVGVPTMKT